MQESFNQKFIYEKEESFKETTLKKKKELLKLQPPATPFLHAL